MGLGTEQKAPRPREAEASPLGEARSSCEAHPAQPVKTGGEPSPRGVSLGQAFVQFLRHKDHLVYLLPGLALLLGVAIRDPRPLHLLLFLGGWGIFLPQEYFSHIYILHFPFPKAWGYPFYRLLYRLHYGHHDYPKRFDLMYIPLWLTLPLALANMALFRGMTQNPYAWCALTSGLFFGYLFFEWSHLFCHLPYAPKTRLGKAIRARHTWHHHRNETHWYAVSAPVLPWDTLFRTGGDLKHVPISSSARFLGLREDEAFVQKARAHFARNSSGTLAYSALWRPFAGEGEP